MSIAVWDDRYKTGHELVDKQHQELFPMINRLHDAIMASKGPHSAGAGQVHNRAFSRRGSLDGVHPVPGASSPQKKA